MRLLELFPVEIEERILMYLDLDEIHELGEDNVPEHVWIQVKHKTIKEAIDNNNLIGLRYLFEHCGVDIHTNGDYAIQMSAAGGHLECVMYLFEKGANIHSNKNYALRFSAANGHLEVVNI
jgi:Ankyrin repeats (3 copies)